MSCLFTGSNPTTVTILGLGYSGKTTLLYLLKTGQIVQTIPTIGFNVETLNAVTTKGKSFCITAWDVGTGCGIRYLSGVLHHYVNCGKALIWMVDASDPNCLPESVEALKEILLSSSRAREDTADKKELPILILVNKSDLPKAMSLDYVRIAFSKITSGKIAAVFKTSLTEVQTGLPEAFEWLQLAIEIAESGKQMKNLPEPLTAAPNPRSPSTLANKLESWLTRNETDCSPDTFLNLFNSFSLPQWDHYTHIRIAYVILTKYGRKEAKDLIFTGLEKYISVSPQTKGRSFHVTMTYFWIQIVHFGIRNMPVLTTSEGPASSQTSVSSQPGSEDFARFLLINPYVADGNLWLDYYAKDTMMSPKAKAEMVLPDMKPLPNLVVRDAIQTFGAK
ncbi:ADP-ribosylation factor 4 [Psilocybe cubensis]|uniref:ADP-ribosylation factor 4 n=2 Tax=Psilocybe cubensis TaxID=181762 RepID=A0ACB8HC47_PSICU|nr:ADP-ribosylation factor 4 [Psilocybe cubensis]KAH9484774.1 ADP-ribosylation factor 4 [Psilocybe cubensis]